MFEKFYPDEKFASIKEITPDFFEKNNIKFAILDIDNTLVSYTKPLADDTAKAFLSIICTELGRDMDCNLLHHSKANIPIYSKFSDNVIVHNEEQEENA
jgi:hypothetical protein